VVARVERLARPLAPARLLALARSLLRGSKLCAIATVNADGSAHINTAYFAYSERFGIVWCSAPQARHSRNVRERARIAIAIFDSTQTWGRDDRGIQLFGTARELRATKTADAERLYVKRFRDATDIGDTYRFYLFRPRRMKMFDEAKLGGATWVTARVGASGRLRWMRTERYV
jgi:uncharacterized protein YhbP (UPF0306 family)